MNRKFLALLLSLCLMAGLLAPLAATATETTPATTTATEPTVAETTTATETTASTEPTAPTKPSAVGETRYLKPGTTLYMNPGDTEGYTLKLADCKVEIVAQTGDWYQFRYIGTSLADMATALALGDYTYVKAESTTQEKSPTPTTEATTEATTEPTDPNACTCPTPGKNLADHPATCPRRACIEALIQGKTPEALYNLLLESDDITQEDILNILEKHHPEQFDALEALMNGDGGEMETTVDGVALTLSGVPEDITLEATTLAAREISDKAFDKIASHKLVFSMDITLKDGKAEWQPKSRQTVTVTLDARDLGLKDGERIGILHEHGGKVKDLGIFTVRDGALTFETDGFSSFYGYTVDFEYDGTWHSIGGGSSILLSELFLELGIDKSADSVTDVDFSDDSLLAVERVTVEGYTGRKGWLLRSLEPFDTQEELTLHFSDGTTLTINVYDAMYTELLGDATLNNGDSIGPVTLSYGQNITLTLNGGTVYITGQITIPAGASLTFKGSGTLRRGNQHTGHLIFVQNGTLKIEGSSAGSIVVDGGASWTNTPLTGSTRELLNVTAGGDVFGAAVYADDATVTLKNLTFQNLYTKYTTADVSPVFRTGNTKINPTISDNAHTTLTMTNVTVKDCATHNDNAIVNTNDCFATLTNCTFTNNYSVRRYAGTLKAGGPNEFCQLTLTNCKATGNYSSGWGGFLLWAAGNKDGNSNTSWAKIDGCNFEGNKARYLGGAISNEAVMTLTNCTFKNNIAMSGGAIASFPFTRTEDVDVSSWGNACTLTFGAGNVLENNQAVAPGNDFKPFSVEGSDGNSDESGSLLATNIQWTYHSGGGGVWCFMNKENWEYALSIGTGNKIQNNTAVYEGGGVQVFHEQGKVTGLTINGAEITGNKAANGGGVYTGNANVTISSGKIENNTASGWGGGIATYNGTCTVTGDGTIKNNTACNGGGVAIVNGTIDVSGGIISGNKAKAGENYTNPATTQVNNSGNIQGVGGGVYVTTVSTGKSTFTLSGEAAKIGIYSNHADTAAADVYANGLGTTLTLPAVAGMNLTGMEGMVPTGWYADYMESDNKYPETEIGKPNPGRYDYSQDDNVEVAATKLKGTSTFYCLTLGLTYPGYGDLVITKKLDKAAVEDQAFLFQITGKTRVTQATYSMTVSLHIKKGQNQATVTVANLPDGTYTITEADWSWRYDEQTHTIYPTGNEEDKVIDKTFTLNVNNPNWTAIYTNKRTEDKWLSGDVYCRNWWGNVFGGDAATN